MRPSFTTAAPSLRAQPRGRGTPALQAFVLDVAVEHEDLVTIVDRKMWVDHEPVALVPDDLGTRRDPAGLRGLQHLEHLASVAADLAGPEPDPNDVGSQHLLERREVALLDRLAHVHHRRSSL